MRGCTKPTLNVTQVSNIGDKTRIILNKLQI